MKVSCETWLGTPPGGAIILGRLDGIPAVVGLTLGVGMEDASWTMLVPITRDVALSVAVADRDITSEGLLAVVGMTGIEIYAEGLLMLSMEVVGMREDVRASLIGIVSELGGVAVALLGGPDKGVEDSLSDAGTLRD